MTVPISVFTEHLRGLFAVRRGLKANRSGGGEAVYNRIAKRTTGNTLYNVCGSLWCQRVFTTIPMLIVDLKLKQ